VYIYRPQAPLLAKGAGLIMISSYLPAVYELADALHVFRTGGLVACNGYKQATREKNHTKAIGV